jgi:hypothetical protein
MSAMSGPQDNSDREVIREHLKRARMYLDRAKAKREPVRQALAASQRELDRMKRARGR